MRLHLTLLLYNLLLPVGLLILLPGSLLKMRRRGGYGGNFWQRLGFFKPPVRERLDAGQGRTWWIHAVSVGEVNVARKLIGEILRREPDRPLVLSVTTSTGYAVALEGAPENLTVIYSPLDFGWVVRAVLRRIRPEKYVLMEAELWPNLVRRAGKRGIPVALANARLSPRSERRYRKFRWLAGPLFSMLDLVMVQEESDAVRWEGIGVPRGRVRCTGSIKYDLVGTGGAKRVAEFRELLRPLFDGESVKLLVAASTHQGEEKVLTEVFLELRREFPGIAFLIAPRHFERRGEVAADLASLGIRTALRSALPEVPARPEVLIIDSTGELRDWQALADVVIIGKSFLATGGQNPAEAIAAGVPVITGPHMENFQALMELLRGVEGITEVGSVEALLPALRQAFAAPEKARESAARGRAALERHRGAAARTAEALAVLTTPSTRAF